MLQLYAIVGTVIAFIAFSGGVYVRDAFCDAAALRVQLQSRDLRIAELERNADVANSLASEDDLLIEGLGEGKAKTEDIIRAYREKLKLLPATVVACTVDQSVVDSVRAIHGKIGSNVR